MEHQRRLALPWVAGLLMGLTVEDPHRHRHQVLTVLTDQDPVLTVLTVEDPQRHRHQVLTELTDQNPVLTVLPVEDTHRPRHQGREGRRRLLMTNSSNGMPSSRSSGISSSSSSHGMAMTTGCGSHGIISNGISSSSDHGPITTGSSDD